MLRENIKREKTQTSEQRETETETDIQRKTDRDRDRARYTEKEIEGERERERRQTDRQTDRDRDRDRDRYTEKEIESERERTCDARPYKGRSSASHARCAFSCVACLSGGHSITPSPVTFASESYSQLLRLLDVSLSIINVVLVSSITHNKTLLL